MPDDKARAIEQKFERLSAERTVWERVWQEIRDLVRPNTADFQRKETPGQVRTLQIYDGTAMQALEELGAGLQSYLTSPAERWFEIRREGRPSNPDDHEELAWLEDVADIIYDEYSRDDTGLNTSLQEAYLDLGAFGTAVVYQEWDLDRSGLLFKALPLADCIIDEDAAGFVDTVYRKVIFTYRQLIEEFGKELLPSQYLDPKHDTMKAELIHAVYPRRDRTNYGLDALLKPYVSCFVLRKDRIILEEKGYDSFPFHVVRWSKIAGETYGRSPAINCLPDIRMLNRMEYTNIKAVQKAVDPPILVPNDGFIMPIRTSPGSINMKEPGSESWEPLEFKGQFPVALEITQQKRDFIRQCFFADWLRMEKEKIEMTAFEVADRRDEKLRFLAPMLGRIQSELLAPLIHRTYMLLMRHNRLPEPPESMRGAQLRVGYSSPASRAQMGAKATAMGRYVQEIIPLAQVSPEVMDAVDLDAYAQELALARGTPRSIIRDPESREQRRADRQQQEAAAAAAQNAEPASQAVLNLAKANQAGNII